MNRRIEKKIHDRHFILSAPELGQFVVYVGSYHNKRVIARKHRVFHTSIAHKRFKDKGYNAQLRMNRISGKLRKVPHYE
jgi:hypothetical protein